MAKSSSSPPRKTQKRFTMPMKVEILSSKFIKPSVQTPPNLRKYKLSFFDQLAPLAFPGIIFFFRSNGNPEANGHRIKPVERLEKSLGETLTRFYPLAGRYIKEELLIDCNDQGVEVLKARVHGPVDEFVHGKCEPELLNNFVPNAGALAGSALSPVVAIQISEFECGGIVVGMRNVHKITDGFTSLTFIKQWAIASQQGIDKVMHPNFDLGSIFPARDLSTLKTNPPKEDNKKLVSRRFVFDGSIISTLKTETSIPEISGARTPKILGVPLQNRPSRVLVVVALIWRTLIALTQAKKDGRSTRPSQLCLSIDLRERTSLPVSKNSFGNLFANSTARISPDRDSKVELKDLMGLLRDGIKKTTEDYAKAQNEDEIFSMLIDYYNEIGANKPRDVDFYFFTSLGRFNCYEVDFGFGKPAWVTTTPKTVELISIMDTKCGEGIEAWVTLKEEDMAAFEQHPDIVALSSK